MHLDPDVGSGPDDSLDDRRVASVAPRKRGRSTPKAENRVPELREPDNPVLPTAAIYFGCLLGQDRPTTCRRRR